MSTQTTSTAWTKGDRKARRQLEKALKSDETDNVTRFALVRLLANKADPVAAEVRTVAFRIQNSTHLASCVGFEGAKGGRIIVRARPARSSLAILPGPKEVFNLRLSNCADILGRLEGHSIFAVQCG